MSTTVIVIIVSLLAVFYFYKMIKRSTAGAVQERAAIKQAGIEFLEANKQVEGVKTTESGLQYLVLQEGTGTLHPKAKDKVKVHYEGTFLDGTVFDSSFKRGKPITFGLNQVIKGWTEGVQLMVVGEKTRFFIPSQLAYGNRWSGEIPPGSTLIFDVELLGVNS